MSCNVLPLLGQAPLLWGSSPANLDLSNGETAYALGPKRFQPTHHTHALPGKGGHTYTTHTPPSSTSQTCLCRAHTLQPLMLHHLRLAFGCLVLCTACHSPRLLLEEHATDLRQARTVATAFYQDFGQDLGLKDIPFVTVGMEGGSGYSYDVSHNVLFLTPFQHADFDTQRFFGRACGSDCSDATYNSLIFEYFTAHQLMHLLYDRLQLPAVAEYDAELRINVLTWVFLRKHKFADLREGEWLAALSALEAQLVSRFPDIAGNNQMARALAVDNNASYWYVSAVNLQEAYRQAQNFKSERAYITQLSGSSVAVVE